MSGGRPAGEDLQRATMTSLAYRGGSSVVRVAALGVRSILLARLLPIEVFGIYAGVRVVVELVSGTAELGLNAAMAADHPLTRDEQRTARTHLLLRSVTTCAWAGIGLVVAGVALDADRRTAGIALIVAFGVEALLSTSVVLLRRRVVHRRLALWDLATDLGSTVVAVALALAGAGLWALLSVHLLRSALGVVLLVLHRPVWRPRLAFDGPVARHLLWFGWRAGLANLLTTVLARIDDLFVATVLGVTPMGLYNRAYTFASYPRKIAGAAVDSVSLGALSAAATREARSQVFALLLGVLARVGFLLAGVLAVAAPEMITVLLGARWLPLLDAFRLMLVFALLDPLKRVLGDVLLACQQPGRLVRARALQLAVLVVGLAVLGPRGISGVAVAVDIMAFAGAVQLLLAARDHVDVDLRDLLGVPLLALVVGLALAASTRVLATGVWPILLLSATAFTLGYGATLMVLERDMAVRLLRRLRGIAAR